MPINRMFHRNGFMMFSLIMFLTLIFTVSANAKTIYVDLNNTSGTENGTEANPYNTIQEGIDVSLPEDVVKVSPGTYSENISINGVNIKLVGDDPETTIISANGNLHAIDINGTFNPGYDLLEITGFSITGGSSRGIYLNSTTVIAEIHNNIIFGNNIGIYGYVTCSASIYNNIITQNADAGITDRNSSGAAVKFTISNNIIAENGTYGIYHPGYGTYLASFNNVSHVYHLKKRSTVISICYAV